MEDGLYAVRFVVNEEPFCLWDWNPKQHNDDFIESFDPYYFEYLGRALIASVMDEDKQRFAIAVRTFYSQALETFFAILGAALQAPHYIPGWLLQYRPEDLQKLVNKIDEGQSVKTHFDLRTVSWESVVSLLHPTLFLDEENGELLKNSMASSWFFFASDFRSKLASEEYNSIKHGLRIRPSGLEMGIASKPNVPLEELPVHIKSEFGSMFLSTDRITNAPRYHLQVRSHHRNWHPQDFLFGLSLLSSSLFNVQQFLKWYNGLEPSEQTWPKDLNEFGNPWEFAHTINAVSRSYAAFDLKAADITLYSKEDILSQYESKGNAS